MRILFKEVIDEKNMIKNLKKLFEEKKNKSKFITIKII